MVAKWVRTLLLGVGVVLAVGPTASVGQDEAAARNFSVLHISDIHVDPRLARSTNHGPVRGAETIRWICEQAGQPQELTPYGVTAPPPTFAIATGDLTEYGVIDETWQVFEHAFGQLPCPLYVLPGNHDNTWTAMYHIMRDRHGGENYSFDRFNCHFVCINSASPQEPLPCIDAKTRAWLKRDLEATAAETPVFVAMHHPPYIDEFANPAEMETFFDMLRDRNVVLLLYGHGHGADTRDVGGIPSVMGGTTYGKNAGYGVLSVQGSSVRYAYRFHRDPNDPNNKEAEPVWKPLVDLGIRRQPQPRLFDIAEPAAHAVAAADKLTVRLTARDTSVPAEGVSVVFRIDGKAVVSSGENPWTPIEIPVTELMPGAHLLTVSMRLPDGTRDTRTRVFYLDRAGTEVLWRKHLPAAVKAGPVLAGDRLIVAGNDGVVTALDKRDGREIWSFTTGGEILGTPAWSQETLVFGSGDGKIYAIDEGGQSRWTYRAGVPVYGPPLIADGVVYIGDNGGRMHALRLANGEPRWTFERADFSLECQPALWKDMVVFGAWDGYVYALDRDDGKLRWKSYGPKSAEGGAARYYAPADCGPLAIGETLFVCDRGYLLGAYAENGALKSKLSARVSAIAVASDNRSLYARAIDDHLSRFDEKGEAIWRVAVPAGRFPVAPSEGAGRVYICSNRGRLSVLDARDGALLWSYQVTPGLYVMAPVTVDSAGGGEPVCYVAGMDGSLTALRRRPGAATSRAAEL